MTILSQKYFYLAMTILVLFVTNAFSLYFEQQEFPAPHDVLLSHHPIKCGDFIYFNASEQRTEAVYRFSVATNNWSKVHVNLTRERVMRCNSTTFYAVESPGGAAGSASADAGNLGPLLNAYSHDGELLWSFSFVAGSGASQFLRPIVKDVSVANDGSLVFARVFHRRTEGEEYHAHADDFVAIDVSNRPSIFWRRTLDDEESQYDLSVCKQTGVLFLRKHGEAELIALSPKTGEELWRYSHTVVKESLFAPQYDAVNAQYITGWGDSGVFDGDARIISLDSMCGEALWCVEEKKFLNPERFFVRDRDLIYFQGLVGDQCARKTLNLETGKLCCKKKWVRLGNALESEHTVVYSRRIEGNTFLDFYASEDLEKIKASFMVPKFLEFFSSAGEERFYYISNRSIGIIDMVGNGNL